MKTNQKVYLNILKEIDQIIVDDQLSPGDKLPSERELAERLKVGRSSVREALRALELLDLIETRKGEGTFIKKSGGHRLAEILARFFLKNKQARKDLAETRRIIEIEAVRLACQRASKYQLEKLENLILQSKQKWTDGKIPVEEDYLFHKTLVESSHNNLMLNIWRPLVEYSKVAIKESLSRKGRMENAILEHEAIFEAVARKDEQTAVNSLRNHLENSRF
ncbi:GntR family transcriptional repressor for pyruvate dehydrogenase complex [Evansella vedderi]|uniref:GntR family transcriptional repressor for pyruvate dehydrogenase complex n=1 Tax=Evansella vedderi TaxID=38282 RepID=A0ABT9ZWB1_9BACI|nr:FadR/GntR family transcriptional regulator [Evansella vedderi]MDQ0255042.1 GntR family transcriptional repressor for pyruvate dehydrogenase complex [Evansella vedderi]